MSEQTSTVKWPVKVWWCAHVVVIFLWCLPFAPPAVRNGRVSGSPLDAFLGANDRLTRNGPAKYYVESTGLWQYWDMFAPDPLREDYYVSAVIQYQDGTVITAEYPRVSKMPVPEKYVKERFRKYIERTHDTNFQYLWPTIAQWMALQNFSDPKNPPVAVNLQKEGRMIPPPTPNLDMNRPFTTTMFHPQMVDVDKLYRDKGWAR